MSESSCRHCCRVDVRVCRVEFFLDHKRATSESKNGTENFVALQEVADDAGLPRDIRRAVPWRESLRSESSAEPLMLVQKVLLPSSVRCDTLTPSNFEGRDALSASLFARTRTCFPEQPPAARPHSPSRNSDDVAGAVSGNEADCFGLKRRNIVPPAR